MFKSKLTVKDIKAVIKHKSIKATGITDKKRGGTNNLFDVSVHFGAKTFSYVLGDVTDIPELEKSLIRNTIKLQEDKENAWGIN